MKTYLAIMAGLVAFSACTVLPVVRICRHAGLHRPVGGDDDVFLVADELMAGPGAQFSQPRITVHNPTDKSRDIVLRCQQKMFDPYDTYVYIPPFEEVDVHIPVKKTKPPLWTAVKCHIVPQVAQ